MTLTQFFTTIRKRWLYVFLPFVLSCLVVGIWSMLSTPVYTAKASAYFSLTYGQTPSELNQGSSYTQQQIASYALLATKPVVLDPVIDELGLTISTQDLARNVSAKASVDSVIVDVTADSTSPEQAAKIANAVVAQLAVVVSGLSPQVDGRPSVEVTTVARAEPPQFQSSPNTRLNVLIAGVAGLLVGVLAALARQHFDTRLRTKDDLPASVAVIGSIEDDKDVRRQPIRVLATSTSRRQRIAHEAFRTLRTNLGFLDVDAEVRVLVVTSSVAGEGKTTVSLNLAAVLAENNSKVILVDADLRRPKVAQYLGIGGALGLADHVAGRVSLDEAIQPWNREGLFVLPAGSTPPNPGGLLGSHSVRDLLDQLRRDYDYVIIDAPPLVPVTDAAVVAHLADGALVVARYGRTTRQQLASSTESLSAAQARLLGIVFNRVTPPKPWSRRSAYEYYASEHASDREPSRP